MRVLKSILVVLLIGGIVFLSISCTASSTSATPKPQIATVQRGTITIAVTGTGNLALEYKEGLSFGQTGLVTQISNAKISDVLVKAGDTVEQGQVLVKADTTNLQDTLTQDQHQLDTAKNNLLTAQNALTTDQNKLLQQADVQAIQTKIDNVNIQLQTAQANLQAAMVSQDPMASATAQYWVSFINTLTVTPTYRDINGNKMKDGGQLGLYEKQMADLIADPQHYLATAVGGTASSVSAILNLQLQIQQDQSNIILRQNAVDDAQTTLNNDKGAAQQIVAPYKGLMTQVNVTPGDIVQRNADLVEIAQPDKFIANILVTERDVMSVKVGGDATVSFDALSGLNFAAKITQIAPVATVQQGVVNYKVTVELTSTRPIFAGGNGTGQRPQQSTTGGTPGATGTPRTTPTSTSAPGSTSTPSGTPRASTGGTPPTGTLQTINLKDGLSATVNIVIQEKTNILMVPSRAITRQGQTSTAQVVKGTTTESVVVKTGITDSANIEITDGLNEGDQVVLRTATAATSTPRPGGGVPGLGGVFRGG